MNLHESFFDEALRRALREQLRSFGQTPPEYIDLIVDLGFQAAQKSCDTLNRVVTAYPDARVSITAMGPALSLAIAALQLQLEALQNIAKESNMPHKGMTLRVER